MLCVCFVAVLAFAGGEFAPQCSNLSPHLILPSPSRPQCLFNPEDFELPKAVAIYSVVLIAILTNIVRKIQQKGQVGGSVRWFGGSTLVPANPLPRLSFSPCQTSPSPQSLYILMLGELRRFMEKSRGAVTDRERGVINRVRRKQLVRRLRRGDDAALTVRGG